MNKINNVLYFSQREEEVVQEYGRKGCGLVSLRIAMSCFVGNIDFTILHDVAKKTGAYTEEIGWTHDGLISIANHFDLHGLRKKCDIECLVGFIRVGSPIIVSMKKEYSKTIFSHLIVLIGYTKDSFIVHDPWDFGPNHKILFEDFEKYWTKRAIVISNAPLN